MALGSDSLRVRYYAGMDPVTGKQVYLRATIPGTDDTDWDRIASLSLGPVAERPR